MTAAAPHTEMDAELALAVYRRMTLIRLFEEQADELDRGAAAHSFDLVR